ncbi:hypothetical protein BVRB_041160, partial [Beta vulgaris subsp. vulgaris]
GGGMVVLDELLSALEEMAVGAAAGISVDVVDEELVTGAELGAAAVIRGGVVAEEFVDGATVTDEVTVRVPTLAGAVVPSFFGDVVVNDRVAGAEEVTLGAAEAASDDGADELEDGAVVTEVVAEGVLVPSFGNAEVENKLKDGAVVTDEVASGAVVISFGDAEVEEPLVGAEEVTVGADVVA